jgi:two-component system LytT family response regulator
MHKVLKALIVDDEKLAREELKELLLEYDKISIVGEANNVDSAIKAINENEPDVIFLDIQMPVKTGFDLVNEIESDAEIIFVTAYDEFALRAFEVNALDYLMKPIYPKRLQETISRLENKVVVSKPNSSNLQNDDYIFFNEKGRSRFVLVDSIICIRAAKEYTEVITDAGIKGLLHRPMIDWERRLPGKNFVRIHRSTIINLHHINEVKPSASNLFSVFMKGLNEPLNMSRRYAAKVKKVMM